VAVHPALAGKRTLIVGDKNRTASVRITGTDGQLQAIYDGIGAALALTCTGRRMFVGEDENGDPEYEVLHTGPCPKHKRIPHVDPEMDELERPDMFDPAFTGSSFNPFTGNQDPWPSEDDAVHGERADAEMDR
jgi:hypothetical protein